MTTYTWNDDLSNISIETLNTTREQHVKMHEQLVAYTRQDIEKLLKTYLPDYHIKWFQPERLTIAPNAETKRNLTIDINVNKPYLHNENELRFEINPSTIGTFCIDADSEERQYFIAIGTILSNKEFHDKLRGMMFNLVFEVNPIIESCYAINDEIRKRERMAKQAKETEDMKAETNTNIKPFFNGVLSDMFVLVDKNPQPHLANATYRKKPIRVVTLPGDMYKISGMKNELDKFSHQDFVVIPADKIKFLF